MVDTQVRPSDVTSFPIIDAMLDVPRERFVPEAAREAAYAGEHVALGGGRVLLDPRTFAKMLETADVTPSDVVLHVGCGLGYGTAVLARLADAVVAVEDDADRAALAQQNLLETGTDNAAVIQGELGRGDPDNAPYDVIVIEGGVETLPDALLAQLRDGGRIVALFMAGVLGVVRRGVSIGGRVSWRDAFNAGAPVLPGFERSREFML